jgi:serine/threonine-protein kinase
MRLPVGTRLGSFEILAPLGAGGMGEVYRARDSRLDREVAVKVLPEKLASDASALARFEREAKAVAALSHPNILAIHEFNRDGETHYVVMELLEGESLAERLVLGPLPWRTAAEIAVGIAEGLSAAHAKGIVHRDLKPQNLFLTRDGRVKILDFGLARREPGPETQSVSHALTQESTTPGTVLGTVGYMSPEQVRGDPVDLRTDLFSLGCVVHEMLTGQRAFRRRTPAETMAAILNEEPGERAGSGSAFPQGLAQVAGRCLEKNAENRFQSARDLQFALKQVLAGIVEPSSGSSGGRRAAIESIAVLPFANISGDPDAEYLSDGIAESIIHGLARLPRLRVMARSTISRFKGREADPQNVGRELGVRAVLAGRVFHRGDSLVVKVELVDGRDGSQIWGENYNRNFSDILTIEQEIAREISEKLRLRLTGEEAQQLTRRATENTEAYRLYLRGRFYCEKRSEDGLRRAIELFQQAINEDPDYALAYAGIAEGYDFLGYYGYRTPAESFPKAKAAASRALEIDPSLSEALAARGVARFHFDRDWTGSEEDFRAAIAASPSYANVHQYLANLLAAMGRFDEALAEVSRAEEIDPLSLPAKTSRGLCLFYARRCDEAVKGLEAALEMDPTFAPARNVLAWNFAQAGMPERAIEEERRAVDASGRGMFYLGNLGYLYAFAGHPAEAEEIRGELEAMSRQRYVSAYMLALIEAALGEGDRSFQLLEEALRSGDWLINLLRVDSRIDPLRSDPRFTDLIRRVGFEEPSAVK